MTSIIESIKETLDDKIIALLLIAATITILTGSIAKGWSGFFEGISIYFAVFVITAIGSANDFMKDKQFVKLQSKIKDEDISVIRGQHGLTTSVNIYDLVVGDVILLETGSRVPADCVLIESNELTVDETFYPGKSEVPLPKTVATDENQDQYPDPFLLSQSLITTGVGKAVVCAVGENSRRGLDAEPLDLNTRTPLQDKLENLGTQFTKLGLYAAVLILIACLIRLIMGVITTDQSFFGAKSLNMLTNAFTMGITIIIVAVPEGLPLTVSLSLAYSVMRM